MVSVDEVLTFWLDEVGPAGWYGGGEALDATVRERFLSAWQEARDGAYGLWLINARGALAYIILTDQFPRNMFREAPEAFEMDRTSLAVAKAAVDRGWDMRIDEPGRQFFYMPLMHSENLCDQDRAVRLMAMRMPETGADNLRHAKAHREVIRQFGRFPYRNGALGRETSRAEADWLETGGYARALDVADAESEVHAGA